MREASLAERRRVAIRAREYMLMNLDESLNITGICQAVHTHERTLHLGFREAFGITPKQFLKSLRLNAIRRDFQRAQPQQTVTALACRWGFFHFSNFASDYFRQFGELPSETLRRSSESTTK
jgi:AraC family ethanolamine operon transcriptional activator